MWDFVASNLDASMTHLFDSSPVLDRNKLHLHDSGKKKKDVIRNNKTCCCKITKKGVNTEYFSRVIFICIAYLLSSYYTIKKYWDEVNELR